MKQHLELGIKNTQEKPNQKNPAAINFEEWKPAAAVEAKKFVTQPFT